MVLNTVDSDAATSERPGRQAGNPADLVEPVDLPSPFARFATEREPLNCSTCGQMARVHILDGYRHGEPIYRRLCLACSAGLRARRPAQPSRPTAPLNYVAVGLGVGLLALAVDGFMSDGPAAYGWLQRGWVAAGAVLLAAGTLLRLDWVAATGTFLFCGALIGGWGDPQLALNSGWKQQILTATAVICVTYGMATRLAGTALRARLRNGLMSARWAEAPAQVGPEK